MSFKQFYIESADNQTPVVIYSGRFQPFHNSHKETYDNVVKKFGKDNVYVASTDKVELPKSPFNFAEKEKVIKTMFKDIPADQVLQIKNNYDAMELKNKFPKSTPFIFVIGKKDADRMVQYKKHYKYYEEGEKMDGWGIISYIYVAPSNSGMDGTTVRKTFAGDDEEAKKKLFIDLYGSMNKPIYKLIHDKLSNIAVKEMNTGFKDFFSESEGVTNRKAGDTFEDQHFNLYTLHSLLKEPANGEFPSVEELDKDIANQINLQMKKLKAKEKAVHTNNKKTNNAKSYMLLTLIDSKKNTPVFIIRYSDRIMSNAVKWLSSELAQKMPELKLRLTKKGGSKTEVMSGAVQVNMIYDDSTMYSDDILAKAEKAFESEQRSTNKAILGGFVDLLKDIHNGGSDKYIAKGMKRFKNVFDVSLAEAIVPMALLDVNKGKNISLFSKESLNNLKDCIDVPITNFSNLKSRIPKNSNERLVDSLVFEGVQRLFSISNKAGKGAAASLSSVMTALEKLKEDKKQYDILLKQYPHEIKILEILNDKKNSALLGAALVAKEYGIINDEEIQQAMTVWKTNSIKGISKNLMNLMKTINSNTNLPGYTLSNHLFTSIAKEFARKANTNPKYMELIKKVLISAKFVQASPNFTESGDDLVLSSIKLIWPPTVNSVKIDANKTYTSTRISGKMAFKVS